MASFLPKDVNPYINKCIKSKLCKHFEDSVTFIEVPGKASTVLFKKRVNKDVDMVRFHGRSPRVLPVVGPHTHALIHTYGLFCTPLRSL